MVTMTNSREECLARFGFSFERGGAHLARSMMLDDLRRLLQRTSEVSASHGDFSLAITEDNCPWQKVGAKSCDYSSALNQLVFP
jgi:hypothetical protein